VVRWARRRPALATLVAVSIFGTILGFGLVSWQWYRAEENAAAEKRAREQAEELQRLADQQKNQVIAAHAATEAQRQRAEANYRKALDAVNLTLRRLGATRLAHIPEMDEVREEFLRDTLEFYRGFLSDKENADPEIRHQTALAHAQVALIQKMLRRTDSAERNFLQGLELYQQLTAQHPQNIVYRDDMAVCLHDLGGFYDDMSRTERAQTSYAKARDIWEALVSGHPGESHYQGRLANCLNSLANLFKTTGRLDDAEKVHLRALGIWNRLIAEHPRDPGYQESLARSHHNLALICLSTNRLEEARTHAVQARTLFERVARAFPRDAGRQENLASCLNNLAATYDVKKQRAEAEKCYQDAIAIRARLVRDHPQVPDWLNVLISSYFNLAQLYRITGRSPLAEKQYEKAIAICTRLAEDYPKVAGYRANLAEGHLRLGMIYEETGRSSEARLAYESARTLQERLARDHPQIQAWAFALGKTYFHLANLAHKGKDEKAAIKWSTKAIGTLEPVLRKDRQDSAARTVLAGSYALRALVYQSTGRNFQALADLLRWHALRNPPAGKPKAKTKS
jgi:tetratricopeptide (TPR) repeat protein